MIHAVNHTENNGGYKTCLVIDTLPALSQSFFIFFLFFFSSPVALLPLAFSSHLRNVIATQIGLCFLYGKQDQMSEIKKRNDLKEGILCGSKCTIGLNENLTTLMEARWV